MLLWMYAQSISFDTHGILCKAVDIYGDPLTFLDILSYPWTLSVKIHGARETYSLALFKSLGNCLFIRLKIKLGNFELSIPVLLLNKFDF